MGSKKNKNTSRGNQNKTANNSRQKAEEKAKDAIECAVCRCDIDESTRSILTCQECKKKVHKGCYLPGQRSSITITCDMCQSKKKKVHCIICRQLGEKQMLKSYEGGFIHVECALISPQVQVDSYSKLIFSPRKEKDNELFAKEKGKITCNECGSKKDAPNRGVGITCLVCNDFGHFRCWVVELGDFYNFAMAARFLDVCQKQNYLLSYLINSRKIESCLSDFFPDLKPATYNLAICQQHETDFAWCPNCVKDEDDYFGCEECGRYYHESCSGVSKDEKFICEGCREKDPFLRQYKLFDLLTEMSRIQKLTRWSDHNFRMLNSFGYKYSFIMEKKISDFRRDIQISFAIKQLNSLSKDEETISTEDKNKIKDLLLFILEGNNWKERTVEGAEQIRRFIDDLSKNKKLASHKELLQKVTKLFETDITETEKFKQFTTELVKFSTFMKSLQRKETKNKNDKVIAEKLLLLSQKFQQIFKGEEEEKNEKFITVFRKQMKNKFLGVILEQELSLAEIEEIVNIYTSIKSYLTRNEEVSEKNHQIMKEKIKQISDRIRNSDEIVNFLQLNLKKIKVKFDGLSKEEVLLKMEENFQKGFESLPQIEEFQYNMIDQNICTIKSSRVFERLNTQLIEFQVLKRKYMNFCKEGDSTITERHFDLIPHLRNFIEINSRFLTAEEKLALEIYQTKLTFISGFLKKGELLLSIKNNNNSINMSSMNGAEQNSSMSQIEENGGVEKEKNESLMDEEQTIFSKLYKVLQNWKQDVIPLDYVLQNLVLLSNMRVKFEEALTFEKISCFAKVIISRIQKLASEVKVKGQLLNKICKIIVYFNFEDEYEHLCMENEEYLAWIRIVPNSEFDVSKILEKPDKFQPLLKTLQNRLNNVPEIQVDLTSEIRKLSLLKQWCLLSDKILSSKRKPTINAVQNLKSLLDRTVYPQNQVYVRLSKLESEGKLLNKQILKYLDKVKVPEFMEIYEELRMINKKMDICEGIQMKRDFESSNLDINAESQELESEIREFQNLPKDLNAVIERGNLAEMKKIRAKYLDCSFKPPNIIDYENLLRKICQLKCTKFEPPITRKEYQQLLSFGGVASLTLLDQTFFLHRAYTQIERAEQELLTSNLRRRNFLNLLPFDEKKIKELREDLKFDPTETNNLERNRIQAVKLRDQFYRLKAERAYVERFSTLEDELLTNLFNCKDILNEITLLKKEVFDFYRKVENTIGYQQGTGLLYDNIFKSERMMLEKYVRMEIRHPGLDVFERDARLYREIEPIINNYSPLNRYREFSFKVCRISDKAVKILELMEVRGRFFFNVLDAAMNTNLDIQVYHALISEGCELKRLQHPRWREIFDAVFNVHTKIKELTHNEEEEEGDEKNSEELQDDQDIDDDLQNDEDEDDDSSLGDEDDDDLDSLSSDSDDYDDGGDKGEPIVLDDD